MRRHYTRPQHESRRFPDARHFARVAYPGEKRAEREEDIRDSWPNQGAAADSGRHDGFSGGNGSDGGRCD